MIGRLYHSMGTLNSLNICLGVLTWHTDIAATHEQSSSVTICIADAHTICMCYLVPPPNLTPIFD
jgi:hypothetical protein